MKCHSGYRAVLISISVLHLKYYSLMPADRIMPNVIAFSESQIRSKTPHISDTYLVMTSSFTDAVEITVKVPGEFHVVSIYDGLIVYVH